MSGDYSGGRETLERFQVNMKTNSMYFSDFVDGIPNADEHQWRGERGGHGFATNNRCAAAYVWCDYHASGLDTIYGSRE